MTTINRDTYWNERFSSRNERTGSTKTWAKTHTLYANRTGVSVPNWKSKIRLKMDASSALQGEINDLETFGGDMTMRYRWNSRNNNTAPPWDKEWVETVWGNPSGYNISYPGWNFLWSSVADGRARNKFLSNVRQLQTKMQGAVFLKELGQTWTMLHRPAEALWRHVNSYYDAVLGYKRSHRGAKWWTAIPSLWLEYTFGWRPLMMDINSGWQALNALLERDNVMRVTGSGTDQHLISHQTGNKGVDTLNGLYTQQTYTNRIIEFDTIKYVGGVRFYAATTFRDQAAQWGFTPAEFLPSLWEILPWSFLIDYFVSIGDFLDATFAQTSNIIWAVKTQRQTVESFRQDAFSEYFTRNTLGAAYVSGYGQPSSAKWRRKAVHRVPIVGNSIIPALYVKWNGPTSGQFANISALFGQASANLHPQRKSGRTFRK